MIHISDNSTLAMLATSPFQFHLTGSRYFGTATPNSDWDFFVLDENPLVRFLNESGFTYVSGHTYSDSNTAAVWKKDNVHVQVVESVRLKLQAQAIIKSFNLLKRDKAFNRLIWNAVFSCLREECTYY